MPIDSALGLAGMRPGVVTSATRPVNPYAGQMIYETDTGWTLVWNGTAWVEEFAGQSGRNEIRNGALDIWQRGFGPWTATGAYTADGWVNLITGCTNSVTGQNFTLGGGDIPSIPGGVTAPLFIRNTVVGVAGAGNLAVLFQQMEDVRRIANKTVTVSFWAKADAAKSIGVELAQNFGTGGSPSTLVTVTPQTVALTTSWARYSLTFVMPSIAGKTLGTVVNHCSTIYFWMAAGSTYASRSGSIPIQSGTFDFWGIQLEEGSRATALERLPTALELVRNQRYLQVYTDPPLIGAVTGAGASGRMSMVLPVVMRATPIVTATGTTNVYDGANVATVNSIAASYLAPTSIQFDFANAANSMVTGRVCILYRNSGSSTWIVTAEL